MQCPLCVKSRLVKVELDENLAAAECPDCGGTWLKSFNYWKWLNRLPSPLPETPPVNELEVVDEKKAKTCPECEKILTRYKVGHGTDFQIDRCGTCAGIWFDKNEWASLKARNLHDDIHFIFGQPWQDRVRRDEMDLTVQKVLTEKLGEEKMQAVREMKQWLDEDRHRSEIIAYLTQNRMGF